MGSELGCVLAPVLTSQCHRYDLILCRQGDTGGAAEPGRVGVGLLVPMISCTTSSVSIATGQPAPQRSSPPSTMGRLPLGGVSPYVRTSAGGSVDPLKFYATSYGTAYGQERFHPRVGHHSGAGYKSNYRPVISYKASLDQVDNPAVGQLLQDNYDTVTTKHFRPLQLPDGKYPLPWSVYQPGSGFVRDKPISFPTTKAVKKVHFNTRDQGPRAITGLEPRQLPVLHKPQGKGSVEGENARHGPLYMSTEYNSKFRFDGPSQPDFLQRKTIGAKEETGFTEGTQRNPIAILPPPPGEPRSQPGISITKTDFLPSTLPHGDEFLPVLSKGSERETGFSRDKGNGLSAMGPLHAAPQPGAERSEPLSHAQFRGLQRPLQTQTNLLGREYVGNKELSGFSINNKKYVTPPYDPDLPNKYLSSYNSKFYDNTLKGVDREGWTRGGIQPQQPGGFATNNHVTELGSDPNATETLRRVHPHVGRTITTVDPFYCDTPHDSRFSALYQTVVPE
ncbi:protein phosphatase 1 regulatory subunit 32 isoform X1 [Trachemys scripta elegans]|uniref:protein phosphatase 1 regulatory subunit 32 isoform X1 n=2 Tax=Trachemys scripta elegans TaxID=31138 RepID=UPI001554CDCF|nr:protein phosphatase 1 regulatory subunit 32 isoform X1 [Trachemys scripta elegans]